MHHDSPLRTPIKRARGLGSAHSGTHHFWVQRVSAVALIPLCIWFVTALITQLLGADAQGVALWLQNPFTALLLAVAVVLLFMHARLGLQTIIEDYIHAEGLKLVTLLFVSAISILLGTAALMAIFKLHFFGI
jgi:succinate dehydrogenase / fumarate reductase membrane anchor subunit